VRIITTSLLSYHELLFLIDTCQANTMYSKFYSPSIIASGSSKIDQSSYSHHADSDVGVAVIDRWTYYVLDFLETQVLNQQSKKTLGDLFDIYDEEKIHSQPGVLWDLVEGGEQGGRERLIMDFFGNVQGVEVDGGVGVHADSVNVTGWREDLRGIERLVEAMRRVNESGGSVNLGDVDVGLNGGSDDIVGGPVVAPVDTPARDYRAPAKVAAEEKWSKQAVGTAVVLGGLSMWFAGSVLG